MLVDDIFAQKLRFLSTEKIFDIEFKGVSNPHGGMWPKTARKITQCTSLKEEESWAQQNCKTSALIEGRIKL